MAYDVASSINELLFENESVILPGFGGFLLKQKNASIDYIKSKISPPARIPSFNKNLTINDGILVEHIKTQNRCTLAQAEKIVKDFIQEMEQKIEQKEIVEFPQVGRIYKDYNKQLQFLPYDTNFNTGVFGLPAIEAHPFSRNEAQASSSATTMEKPSASAITTNTIVSEAPDHSMEETTVSQSSATTSSVAREEQPAKESVASIPVGKSNRAFRWAQMTMPLLLIATVAVISLSYFLLRKGGTSATDQSDATASMAVNDSKKINTSPSIDEAEITTLPTDDDMDGDSEDGIAYDDSNSNDESTSSFATGTDEHFTKECIVIVAQFSSKSNARKYVQKVEDDGYESYEGWNDKKNWNTVGVKFSYENENQKEQMVEQLKREYDDAAWVLRD